MADRNDLDLDVKSAFQYLDAASSSAPRRHTATIETSYRQPVTQEQIKRIVRDELRYEVQRDIHHHNVQGVVQPMVDREFVPAKHWARTSDGRLVEISPNTTVGELYTAPGSRAMGGDSTSDNALLEIKSVGASRPAAALAAVHDQPAQPAAEEEQREQNLPAGSDFGNKTRNSGAALTGTGLSNDGSARQPLNAQDTNPYITSAQNQPETAATARPQDDFNKPDKMLTRIPPLPSFAENRPSRHPLAADRQDYVYNPLPSIGSHTNKEYNTSSPCLASASTISFIKSILR